MRHVHEHIWAIALTCCMLAYSLSLQAQRRTVQEAGLSWAEGIAVDGNLEEWGDSLAYEYESQGLQYQIMNDDTHVYIAMRVLDYDRQMQVLSQGFSFMVNTSGKRRPGPTVVYPIADRLSYRAIMSADNEDRPEDMREGGLKAIRAIYVLRFEDILDGQISLDNQYGIEAGAKLDTADALCFEAKVPLRRLGIARGYDKELAFNVKINGMIAPRGGSTDTRSIRQRSGYYGSPYGYPYGYGYGSNTPARPREEPGKWIISALATPGTHNE